METTQIYTHVHIEALREIHARTHPHGRLDETHDMYGLISAIETPEHDLPSPPAENPLQPEAMWVATAPGPEVSAAQAGISNGSYPEPPDEEPPAGGSPCATPKPPPTGGPSSAKSPFALHKPAQKSTEFQRFRPGVTYYGYRWMDPRTGRWPSRDPIQERGGINLYGFVGNDGINSVDVLGRNPFALFIAGFANIIAQAVLPSCSKEPCTKGGCKNCVTAIGVVLHTSAQVGLAAALSACIAGGGPFGAVICIGLYPSSAAITAGMIQESLNDAYKKCEANCCDPLP